ncbi:hypothetical protein CYG48_18805 (plasmid) [Neorhizobium sp. SOG26]|uniref:hypothetical protein n=1 Tax=Neorhizobium sp. SOG26 TaxID=2060726 RepID=UPI000E57CA29|nr:hypothetical protein [Neorhizobium sp. SOG26]AXV17846.1 hypothetical protein CYG48_18805 [Neorhizobium sp. SOG26]
MKKSAPQLLKVRIALAQAIAASLILGITSYLCTYDVLTAVWYTLGTLVLMQIWYFANVVLLVWQERKRSN